MAGLQNLLPPPELGQLYVSFDTLKNNIEDWSIREKINFIVAAKDTSRVIYKCQDNTCDWRLRANKQADNSIKTSTLSLQHTCIAPLISRSTPTYRHWLQRHIPQYLHITKSTQFQAIIDCASLQFGEIINNQVAKKLKTSILKDDIKSHRVSFETIPAWVSAVRASNPTAYIHLQQNVETSQFQQIFLCLAESNSSFLSCRAFIAVDGIFIKTWFQQILLLAVTLDPNNNILVLVWAVVESDNRDS